MNENPAITSKELAKQLEITLKGIEWQLKRLKEQGKIKHIGATKKGYWKIIKDKESNEKK